MAKGVMISVRPMHCDDIVRLDKTWEIRKNKPNFPTPFKCYIYRTKGKVGHIVGGKWEDVETGGKVVAEFICDKIVPINVFENGSIQDWSWNELEKSCISYQEMADYIGWGRTGYGWHISDLKVYEEGKKVSEFSTYNEAEENSHFLSRPFQSWGYVETI